MGKDLPGEIVNREMSVAAVRYEDLFDDTLSRGEVLSELINRIFDKGGNLGGWKHVNEEQLLNKSGDIVDKAMELGIITEADKEKLAK